MKKENLKSNVATGVSSAAGAAVGVIAGTMASGEIHAATAEEEVTVLGSEGGEEDILVIDSEPSSAPAQNPADTTTGTVGAGTIATGGEATTTGGQTTTLGGETGGTVGGPTTQTTQTSGEVQVVAFHTTTNEDGSHSNVAVLSDGTNHLALIDADQDGIADVMVADVNHDGQICDEEVADIHDQNIVMPSNPDVFNAGMEDPSLMAQNAGCPDYVNNADVDSYMA